jgi:hypothetical protein
MPGNCPASLGPTAVRLWKTFRSKLNAIPVMGETVRLPTGIAFTFDRIPHSVKLRGFFLFVTPLITTSSMGLRCFGTSPVPLPASFKRPIKSGVVCFRTILEVCVAILVGHAITSMQDVHGFRLAR